MDKVLEPGTARTRIPAPQEKADRSTHSMPGDHQRRALKLLLGICRAVSNSVTHSTHGFEARKEEFMTVSTDILKPTP